MNLSNKTTEELMGMCLKCTDDYMGENMLFPGCHQCPLKDEVMVRVTLDFTRVINVGINCEPHPDHAVVERKRDLVNENTRITVDLRDNKIKTYTLRINKNLSALGAADEIETTLAIITADDPLAIREFLTINAIDDCESHVVTAVGDWALNHIINTN